MRKLRWRFPFYWEEEEARTPFTRVIDERFSDSLKVYKIINIPQLTDLKEKNAG